MPAYRVESCVISRPVDLQQEWIDLQERADCSYFQSWGWIGTWLEQVARGLHPVVVRVFSHERLVGAGIFVPGKIRRHAFIRSRAIFLNEYPFDSRNMVIEYNGLLAERGYEHSVYEETLKHLCREYEKYDEFHFGAITRGIGVNFTQIADKLGVKIITSESSTSRQIGLSQFASGLDACLGSLSKNRRTQIRRSIRLYEGSGPLALVAAKNSEEALDFLDELKLLHTERWQSRGKPGSFANPVWENFHRALIKSRFDKGEVQLLKAGTAGTTIGYVYSLVWRKRVYVVQTGLENTSDKRHQPGYVVHALAATHNKATGMALYDFMHGDSLYKRILGNQSQELRWMTFQRRRLKFTLENLAIGAVRRYRSPVP